MVLKENHQPATLQVRFATVEESVPAKWNDLVGANPAGGDFVQAHAYAVVKERYGWKPHFLVFQRNDQIVSVSLVLEYRIPLLGKYWYLPHGPAVATLTDTREHIEALLAFVRENVPGVFVITTEPQIREEFGELSTREKCSAELAPFGGSWHPGLHANTNTALLDIAKPVEEIFDGFASNCRRNIRRAKKDELTVEKLAPTPAVQEKMLRLRRLVGGGSAKLNLRNDEYTRLFWEAYAAEGLGQFYAINGVDGEPAVMAYNIIVGDRAFYKDGGSERPRTSPGMSNLLQWGMIIDAAERGCREYDFVGSPPRARVDDQSHIEYWTGRFKLTFAKEVTEFVGAYDFGLKPLRFKLWQRAGVAVMQRWYRKRYKDLNWY